MRGWGNQFTKEKKYVTIFKVKLREEESTFADRITENSRGNLPG